MMATGAGHANRNGLEAAEVLKAPTPIVEPQLPALSFLLVP